MLSTFNFIDAVILGLLQGLTEFLPVSSSGHLIIVEKMLGLPAEYLKSFDISIHLGTFFAVMAYFWRDLVGLLKFYKSVESRNLLFHLAVGSIPALFCGYFWGDFLDGYFRNPVSVAVMLITVGALFFVIEAIHKIILRKKGEQKIEGKKGFTQAVVIGLAQALALIPGVSRSGATIAAGLAQGVKREEAARFSFLLGSVAIFAASALSIYGAMKGKIPMPSPAVTLTGMVTSFFTGFISIAFLMKFLKKHTLNVFGIYRIAVGILIILFFV